MWAYVIAFCVGAALCTSKLFGQFGVDSAWVLSIVLSLVCALRVVQQADISRLNFLPKPIFVMVARVLACAWLPLAVHALYIGACAQIEGFLFHLLGPALSCLLSALLAARISPWVPQKRFAYAFVLGIIGLDILLGLYEFVFSPGVYSYGQFWGYFPGPIYDRVVFLEARYVVYRLVTLGWVVLLTLVSRTNVPLSAPVSMLVGWLVTVGLHIAGPHWYWRASAHTIEKELGATYEGAYCRLVLPKELSQGIRTLMARDCDFHVARHLSRLNIRHSPRITAYYFRTRAEKKLLMGAADTYLAKPWRNEVYLNVQMWPHPVISHELAHVVLGVDHPNLLQVPGRLEGAVPSIGIIEGAAVALAWEVVQDQTIHQWAKAVRELPDAPSSEQLHSLRFLMSPSAKAYVLTGSFMKYLLDAHGGDAFLRLYRSGDFSAAYRTSFNRLATEWLTFLKSVAIDDHTRTLAKLRFETLSLFDLRCGRYSAKRLDRVRYLLRGENFEIADRVCAQLSAKVPEESWAHVLRINIASRAARPHAAEHLLRNLPDETHILSAWRSLAAEWVGDAYWRSGDLREALRWYKRLDLNALDHEHATLLRIKMYGVQKPGAQAYALAKLMLVPVERGAIPRNRPVLNNKPSTPPPISTWAGVNQDKKTDSDVASVMLSASGDANDLTPEQRSYLSVARYLLGSRYLLRQDFFRARRYFESAMAHLPAIEGLDREFRQSYAISLAATGALKQSESIWKQLPVTSEGQKTEQQEWLDRLDYLEHAVD